MYDIYKIANLDIMKFPQPFEDSPYACDTIKFRFMSVKMGTV